MSGHSSPSYALLVEDVEGHSEQFVDTICPALKQIKIPKGSLVESLPPSDVTAIKQVYKFQVNYSVYSSSPHVSSDGFLFAMPNQLYNLTVKQRDLLLAVERLTDRVEVLKNLCWIELLVKGSKVFVTIDTKPVPIEGVIKHIGERPGAEGTRFEVEIVDVKERVVSNASNHGKHVEEKIIVSVSMDMLTDVTTAVAAKPHNGPAPSEKIPPIRICDYVSFRDGHGHTQIGTVRWIGTDDDTTIVGIEVTKSFDLIGIPHSITMPPETFPAVENGSKIFLPIHCLKKEILKKADNHNIIIRHDDQKDDSGDEYYDAASDHSNADKEPESTSGKHDGENNNNDSSGSRKWQNPYNLTIGSVVQYSDSCGEIKWIGSLPGANYIMAGLVMDKDIDEDYHDGNWEGVQYYPCPLKRGNFVELKSLKPYNGHRKELSQENSPLPAERINDMPHSHGSLTNSPCSLPSSLPHNPHNLEVGSVIQNGDPPKYGVIKWIGIIPPREKVLYAGVEMDKYTEHATNGVWAGVRYFESHPGRGKFVPLQSLQPDQRLQTSLNRKDQMEAHDPSPNQNLALQKHEDKSARKFSHQEQSQPWPFKKIEKLAKKFCGGDKFRGDTGETDEHKKLPHYSDKDTNTFKKTSSLSNLQQHDFEVGSAVQHGDPPRYGTIKGLLISSAYSGTSARIEWDYGGSSEIRLSELQPDGRFLVNVNDTAKQRKPSVEMPALRQPQHYKLETDTAVQYGDPPRYGTVKELLKFPLCGEPSARIEWEFGGNNEIPLSELQPDGRFAVDVNDTAGQSNPLEKNLYEHENELILVPPKKFDKHMHTKTKGIQGCQNSCYLDATLYGLFTFSDAFDFVFLDVATPNSEEQHVQKVIKNKIVYPLRVKGVVIQDSIQVLRTQLSDVQKIKSFTSDEKDPEEFLNLLFKHILHLDPFVHIRRPSGVDKEFLIQLFVTPVKGVSVVHTQHLLTKMFLEQNISFVKYPARLLLQMPRYGKKFKSFQRIIPSLELDIKELCEARSGPCFVCGNQSNHICNDCSIEPSLNTNTMLYFCDTCSPLWHKKPHRHNHNVRQLKIEPTDDFDIGKLQLLSVLCIETSHYVCFTRPTENDWVFFDSMADRLDNGYNLPNVTDCTQLLQEYVYGGKDISGVPSRNLHDLVRRFVEDASMCIYVDPDGVMYQ